VLDWAEISRLFVFQGAGTNGFQVVFRDATMPCHSRFAVWVTLVVGFVAASPRLLAATDGRVALVIGNAEYASVERLTNPLNDAADMCAALKQLGYDASCHANVKDRKEFISLLRSFTGQLTPNSKALFYYAGHAVQVKGENYLVPTKARARSLSDVAKELVGVDLVLSHMKSARVEFSMIVLDACRDNPFVASTAGKSRSRSVTPSTLPESVRTPMSTAGDVAYGLGAIRDAPVGSIVLYATGSDDVAYDGEGRNGPLTKHLLAHLQTPGITVEEMIKRVTAGVQHETLKTVGRRQTPFVYSSFTGEYCFAGCGPKVDVSEMKRLREERAVLERRLAEPPKKPQIFVPPTL
jgi:uncharacterized caspase-like protein